MAAGAHGAKASGETGSKRPFSAHAPAAAAAVANALAGARPARPLQVLTCTEDMMQQRVDFLLQQGLSQAELGRAVLAHPQVGPQCKSRPAMP